MKNKHILTAILAGLGLATLSGCGSFQGPRPDLAAGEESKVIGRQMSYTRTTTYATPEPGAKAAEQVTVAGLSAADLRGLSASLAIDGITDQYAGLTLDLVSEDSNISDPATAQLQGQSLVIQQQLAQQQQMFGLLQSILSAQGLATPPAPAAPLSPTGGPE